MNELTLSVSQLNTYIKRIIDAEELLIGIGLFGEVSNFKYSGKNAYFDLKEENAQISCMIFDCKESLSNGQQVLLFGRLNFYPKFGKISFIASKVEKHGMGALYEKFLELKSKLEKEGVFDSRYKKQIPQFANKIGVVTSETGAVIHDIFNVTRRKNPFTDLVIFPVKVQGVGAENEIAEAIKFFSDSNVDTIIVARGGGSFEDLAPFNTEIVARAIFACQKPLISAVGHETDFSLSDFASDLRAPTPSVAAELAVFDFFAENQKIKDFAMGSLFLIEKIAEKSKIDVFDTGKRLLKNLQALQSKEFLFVKSNGERLKQAADNFMKTKQAETDFVSMKIEKTNPMTIMKQGYSRVTKQGKTVFSIEEIEKDDKVDILFYDGVATAKIEKKEKK